MHNPPHPGLVLREDVVLALELEVGELAEMLGVHRVTLSKILNAHAAITPEFALRLEKWLGPENGGSADTWLQMQQEFDLWQARKMATQTRCLAHIKRYKRTKPTA
ncbi:MAG: hypothetical protein RLZZ397_143 [Pseudomonadota bacterium]